MTGRENLAKIGDLMFSQLVDIGVGILNDNGERSDVFANTIELFRCSLEVLADLASQCHDSDYVAHRESKTHVAVEWDRNLDCVVVRGSFR